MTMIDIENMNLREAEQAAYAAALRKCFSSELLAELRDLLAEY